MIWTIDEIGPAVMEGLARGYALDNALDRFPVPGFPRSKRIHVNVGQGERFTLVDWWFTHSVSKEGFGNTILYAGEEPVWAMHYCGGYTDDAMPVLKEALRAAYSNQNASGHTTKHSTKFFLGCRGPRVYHAGKFTYMNLPDEGSTFNSFSGNEQVLMRDGCDIVVGRHQYHGGFLAGPPR